MQLQKSKNKLLFQNLKNFVINKRIFICLILLLVIVGIFFPTTADAIWDAVRRALLAVLGAVVFGFFWATSGLHRLLMRVINPFFLAYLRLAEAPIDIVIQAWMIVRDLVNATFIIILTWIGIAVILKLKEYEMGKILPITILMIILVQFTPPIINMIVHTANDISRTFLELSEGIAVKLEGRGGEIDTKVHGLRENLTNPPAGMPTTRFILLALEVIAYAFFFIFSFFINLLFVVVFFFRVIMIWLLSVVAPIAFASYIIPQTRSFWTQWWHQLIQWSILPIFLSFGMWMTHSVVIKGIDMPAEIGAGVANDEAVDIFQRILGELMTPLFALGFLIGVLIIGMKSGAIGATGIIGAGTAFAAFATGAAPVHAGRVLKNTKNMIQRQIRGAKAGLRLAEARGGGFRTKLRLAAIGVGRATKKEWKKAPALGLYDCVKEDCRAAGSRLKSYLPFPSMPAPEPKPAPKPQPAPKRKPKKYKEKPPSLGEMIKGERKTDPGSKDSKVFVPPGSDINGKKPPGHEGIGFNKERLFQ